MAVTNPVNTVGVMGKGLALEFKKRYPDMYKTYRSLCASQDIGVGLPYLYRGEPKWVLNFVTKKHWKKPSRLEWIEAGLINLDNYCRVRNVKSLGIPKLGCGAGGLKWEQVQTLIHFYLHDSSTEFYVHI